jgi:hypothetical protein
MSPTAEKVLQYIVFNANRLGQPRPSTHLVLSTLAAVGCTPLPSDTTIQKRIADIVRLISRLIPRLRFEV